MNHENFLPFVFHSSSISPVLWHSRSIFISRLTSNRCSDCWDWWMFCLLRTCDNVCVYARARVFVFNYLLLRDVLCVQSDELGRVMSIAIYIFNGTAHSTHTTSLEARRQLSEWVSMHPSNAIEIVWSWISGWSKWMSSTEAKVEKRVTESLIGVRTATARGALQCHLGRRCVAHNSKMQLGALYSWKCINYVRDM